MTNNLSNSESTPPKSETQPGVNSNLQVTNTRFLTSTIVQSWEQYIQKSIQEIIDFGIIKDISRFLDHRHLVLDLLNGKKVEIGIDFVDDLMPEEPDDADAGYGNYLQNSIIMNGEHFRSLLHLEFIMIQWAKTQGLIFSVGEETSEQVYPSWYLELDKSV